MDKDLIEIVGLMITVVVTTGGTVAYVHNKIRGSETSTDSKIAHVHERVRVSEERSEAKLADAKRELEGDIHGERRDRIREHERLEMAIESFRSVAAGISGLAEGVRHLGERFSDHQKHTDRRFDEIVQITRSSKE